MTPTNGKVCFNPMPEEIAKKINNDLNLFKEFKIFTCKMQIGKPQSKRNMWTFPEFKGGVNKKSTTKVIDINFPDPKYYMIGFTLSDPNKSQTLDHSSFSSVEQNKFSNSQMEGPMRNFESFQEPLSAKHKVDVRRPKPIAQKNMTMKYKLRKDIKKQVNTKAKNYIIFDKTHKLNASVLTERDRMPQKKKGYLFKSAVEPNKTISEVNSSQLKNSMEKPKASVNKSTTSNGSYNGAFTGTKKLSSGVVKKFDKALALTSRVARVSVDNK